MFERRHYEWLARWAGDNINPQAAKSLATALANDNPAFQKDHFLVVYGRRRLAHLAHVEATKRSVPGGSVPMPVPIVTIVDLDNI